MNRSEGLFSDVSIVNLAKLGEPSSRDTLLELKSLDRLQDYVFTTRLLWNVPRLEGIIQQTSVPMAAPVFPNAAEIP